MVRSYKKKPLKNSPIKIVMILPVLTVTDAISLKSTQNIRFLRQSLFHILYFMSKLPYIHDVWLYSMAIKLSGSIKENSQSVTKQLRLTLVFM